MKKDVKELISYIIVGGCTTLINFVIYCFLIQLNHGWLGANIISWFGAVIFAFYANKRFVFKSNNEGPQEAYQFFVLRLSTLVIESGLLFLFIQLLMVNELIAKVIVSVITVILNYWLCKYKIFVGGHTHGQD